MPNSHGSGKNLFRSPGIGLVGLSGSVCNRLLLGFQLNLSNVGVSLIRRGWHRVLQIKLNLPRYFGWNVESSEFSPFEGAFAKPTSDFRYTISRGILHRLTVQ